MCMCVCVCVYVCVLACIHHISKEHRISVDHPEKMLLLHLIHITATNAQLGYSSHSPLHRGITQPACACMCVCL